MKKKLYIILIIILIILSIITYYFLIKDDKNYFSESVRFKMSKNELKIFNQYKAAIANNIEIVKEYKNFQIKKTDVSVYSKIPDSVKYNKKTNVILYIKNIANRQLYFFPFKIKTLQNDNKNY